MIPSTPNPTPLIHHVLTELGLPLPLQPESSWALTHLRDWANAPADCRLTLCADGDLLIEVTDRSQSVARYLFDGDGHLVSVSQSRHAEGALLDGLRAAVLMAIRRRCLLA